MNSDDDVRQKTGSTHGMSDDQFFDGTILGGRVLKRALVEGEVKRYADDPDPELPPSECPACGKTDGWWHLTATFDGMARREDKFEVETLQCTNCGHEHASDLDPEDRHTTIQPRSTDDDDE